MSPPRRATIFGGDAAGYDEYRPGYPAEVIDRITSAGPASAVDVGCGTGLAARLVAARGVAVLGVEPDERMAAVARRHGIAVQVTTLEAWLPVRCDLMYAAQSWHWVDPIRGAAVAAAAVRPGGRWAAFWNQEDAPDLMAVVHGAYRRLAPHLELERVAVGPRVIDAATTNALTCDGAFVGMVEEHVSWTEHLTVAGYVERLATHSGHRLLAPGTAAELHEVLRNELGGADALLSVRYLTSLFMADRC